MIIVDDVRALLPLAVFAAILMVACFLFSPAEPTCPAGSIARHTRSGWFCVVPEVK
jgi:hypothetical protein